ncbi:hypothetical protein [Streptomyces sp. NPDC048277]|uniref:hypothetical protein n=1 Tax=Streptomyces sp. NPDC048277 TaxID=3155027 RepID=UPI0034108D97
MKIRRAAPAEVDLIAQWRAERAAWLARKGRDQWGSAGLRDQAFLDRVSSSIEAGETWMLTKDDEPIATIAIDQWSDPGLWSPSEMEDALFLHRLISPVSGAHHGTAGPLLSHALGLAAQQQKRYLRLDAWSTNTALHQFWIRHGFEHLRTVAGVPSGALFERPVYGGGCVEA